MIVNADDFGYTPEVNAAVVRAFSAGLVSSATVMANMPGFEEACELAHERRLLDHVGVHLVLNEGEPLTDPIRRCRRFCDADGRFVHWQGSARVLRIDAAERRALARELTAQVARCHARGLAVTHIDSHHHAHTELALTRVVVGAARALGVPAVRLMQNCGPISKRRRAYVSAVNGLVRAGGLAATRYFGTFDDHRRLRARGKRPPALDSFELMTHPVTAPDGTLIDALEGAPLAPLVRAVDRDGTATSFTGARYAGD